MKKIITVLFVFTSLSSFAEISENCSKEAETNKKLQAQLRTIELNVGEYERDITKGFSRETGDALIRMACAPFEPFQEREEFDLCRKIEINVKAYQEDSTKGYSLGTAKALDRMGGSQCLIH